ncbi:phosphatidylinositol N-acetylglucosaminyltransferase subunit Q-like [Asterias amurensis]|uniref:phosphatidylinositol N-acetylglucosaminyltransferase subunit Q-like n=1 Tax=Asterias amurensis TaxID=7602 RepID=UPI003AB72DD0
MPVMRIFFPDFAIKSKSSVCIGWVDYQTYTICILAVIHLPVDLQNLLKELQTATCVRQKSLVIIGPSTHQSDPEAILVSQLCQNVEGSESCLELSRPNVYSLPTCTLLENGRPKMMQDYHLIFYNQLEVLKCCLSKEETTKMTQGTQPLTEVKSSGDNSPLNMGVVLTVIQKGVRQLCALKDRTDLEISIDEKLKRSDTLSAFRWFSSVLWKGFLSILQVSSLPFRSIFCKRWSEKKICQLLLKITQAGCQIRDKCIDIQCLVNTHSHEASDDQQDSTMKAYMKNKLRSGNLLSFLVIDTLLGMILMWWILHNNRPVLWTEWIISSANNTAESLQKLLQWLMGAPAGLKLNSALAQFLGQFFLYHVYLWIGYLSIMEPILSSVIWCMSLTGCLGVSVCLAVASDMASMLTFHIYCFYVYAARLYRFQLTGLLALSRLFRGKKWNVLRKRVDTCNYDVDQLFIGTLLFTILLFLFPTTTLFYAVFTGLRLAVIVLKGVLIKTVEVLRRFPAYSFCMSLTGIEALYSGVKFDLIKHQGDETPQAFVMKVQYIGLFGTLQLAYQDTILHESSQRSSETGAANQFLALGSDIISGHLIYPMELNNLQTM